MAKSRLNISLDEDLIDFIKIFAAENRISIADMVTQYLLALKRKVEGENTERILANPAFEEAMEEVQTKLSKGTAKWHSYEDVFGA